MSLLIRSVWIRGLAASLKRYPDTKPLIPYGLPDNRIFFVSGIWQTCDAYSAVAFVLYVEADEECGNLLDDAGIFQFPAINGPHACDFRSEFHRDVRRSGIVAADNHIAVQIFVAIEHVSRNIVECCC